MAIIRTASKTLISKNSNGARFTLVPNGLGQTHIGIKGEEHIASDWSLVFKFENGFDPYTLQRANGPKSLVENNTTPLDAQTATATRAGQGSSSTPRPISDFSHPTYGDLLAGRQNSLIVDGASRFDPMGAASSFSVLGVSNTVAGGGDTQDARYNTSLKYRIGVGPFHFAGLYQFGGFDQGNGSNGAISLGMTGDFGPLSFGVEGEKNKDAVSLSNFAQFPLPAGVSANALKATLSNNTSGVVGVRYTFGNAALYSGWEYILFANPSDAYPDGFNAVGNYPVPAGFVNSTAYTEHKILRVFWTGVKYALRDNLDVAGAYYHYYQNDYNTAPCTDGGLSASSCRRRSQRVLRDDQLSSCKARRGLRRLLVVASHRRLGERLSLSRQLRADNRRPGEFLRPRLKAKPAFARERRLELDPHARGRIDVLGLLEAAREA